MILPKRLALAAVLVAAPLCASASELSYSHIEGGLGRAEVQGETFFGEADSTMTGEYIRGSVAVAESLYLFGGYETASDNAWGFGTQVETDETHFGVGYRHPLSGRTDLISELAHVRRDVQFDDGFGTYRGAASGARVSVGLRGGLSDNFEGLVKASYYGGDFDGDFTATAGLQWRFTPTWGVVGEAEAGGDATKLTLGMRASF